MLHRYPFIRILLAFVCGTILAKYFILQNYNTRLLLLVLCAFMFFLSVYFKRKSIVTGVLLSVLLIISGIFRYFSYNRTPEFSQADSYICVVKEYPVEKSRSLKAEVQLIAVSQNDSLQNTREKVIAYFESDSTARSLTPGSQIIFTSSPTLIQNSGNPFEFDYEGYMANQRIYRQVYLRTGEWKVVGLYNRFSLSILSEKIRHSLLEIYFKNGIAGEKFAILSALTLGYKDALDPETKQVFSSAGAMHVLAVSGLHVGIIFMALVFFFGFLRKSKKGKWFFFLLSTTVLWIYAFITGLSPSVLRATVMFSFVLAGFTLRRPTQIFNTLALSAFFLLFISPNLLFSVGFQLSYLAVTGIIYFQPKIEHLIEFKYKVTRWCWSLFSVSVAAQLSTFPLTLFYFHQFPVYFWLSNFIVIPGAFILIFLGLSILATSWIPALSSALAWLTTFILDGIYNLLDMLQEFPFSVIQEINISPLQLFFLLLVVVLFGIYISKKQPEYLSLILISLILIFSVNIYHKIIYSSNNKVIVYNSQEGKLIHLIAGADNYLLYENESQPNSYDFEIAQNCIRNYQLNKPQIIKLDSICENKDLYLHFPLIVFKGKTIWAGEKAATPEMSTDFVISSVYSGIEIKVYNKKNRTSINNFQVKKEGAFIHNF